MRDRLQFEGGEHVAKMGREIRMRKQVQQPDAWPSIDCAARRMDRGEADRAAALGFQHNAADAFAL